MFRAVSASVTLVLAEVLSHPARGALLAITLAIAVAAWLGLAALAAPFVGSGGTTGQGTGVTVANARGSMSSIGPATSLPQRYAAKIATLPGVRSVRYLDVLPLICRPPTTTATLNAIGGPGVDNYLKHNHVPPQLAAKWKSNPLAVLVGAKLAAKCGWHADTTVSPPDPIRAGRAVEIHIVGIISSSGSSTDNIAIAHYAYVNRVGSLAGRHKVLFVHAVPTNPRDANVLAARIESAFAHADPPVVANPNSTFQNALAKYGQIQNLLGLVMLAVFLCALLVLVSVLAHAVAERRREMAVMQVLGFTCPTLFRNVVLEFLLVVIIGSASGVGVGIGALTLIRNATSVYASTLLGHFSVPVWAWHWLPVWLLVMLGAGLIAPALTLARLRPIDYQKA